MTSNGFLQGGEPFEISGMSSDGVLAGTLPKIGMRVEYRTQDVASEAIAPLDTVLIQPTERHFTLVWRLHVPAIDDLQTVRVTEA